MLIKEYRIPLPFTVEEYRIAQLFTVAQTSLEQTGGGEGVEILKNEPFKDEPLLDGKYSEGQYTKKIHHCATKLPRIIGKLAPKGALTIHEESWNAFPYCKTVLTNPEYMEDAFHISVESLHFEDDDGQRQNAHSLTEEELKTRQVELIDIALSVAGTSSENPSTFRSTRTERGPLEPGVWWRKSDDELPIMWAYKLVRCEFKWRGLQNLVEKTIQTFQREVFVIFHQKLFCWIDRWYGMTIEDIRKFEEGIAEELEDQRKEGQLKAAPMNL